MALQTIGKTGTGSKYANPSKMAVGDKVEGYYLGFKAKENSKYEGAEVIVLRTKAGQDVQIDVQGSLRYLREDVKKLGQEILAGAFTVITKTGSYVSKKSGKTSPSVSFQQDADDILNGTAETAAAAPAAESIEARLAKKKASA